MHIVSAPCPGGTAPAIAVLGKNTHHTAVGGNGKGILAGQPVRTGADLSTVIDLVILFPVDIHSGTAVVLPLGGVCPAVTTDIFDGKLYCGIFSYTIPSNTENSLMKCITSAIGDNG